MGGADLTAAINGDVFLAKLDPDGNHLWSKDFGGDGIESMGSIKVDSQGNILVAGWFYSSVINFGGVDLNNTLPGSGDVFLVKFDNDGNHLWSKAFGGNHNEGVSIVLDANDNIIMTGAFSSQSINFGGAEGLINSNEGEGDICLVKLDPDGNHLWSQSFGAEGSDSAYFSTVDSEGNIFISGVFTSSVLNIGGEDLVNHSDSGIRDTFLAKYDQDGQHLWSKSFGGNLAEAVTAITARQNGDLIITGYFVSLLNLGGEDLINNSPGSDVFLAEFDSSGNHLWSKSVVGGFDQEFATIALDQYENLLMLGVFRSQVIELENVELNNLGEIGSSDLFLSKFE